MNSFVGKSFFISTDDISRSVTEKITFGFTKSKNVIACPDYTFYKWVECGIEDYNKTIESILSLSENEPVFDKLFWIGNPRTQPLRFTLIELGNLYPDKLSFIPMDWIRKFPRGHMHRFTHFVSLEEHTKYKFLIDCGAAGYSGRLKFLLHTNRPLFLVDREDIKKEFFHNELIPFLHYIPVRNDLSDLMDKLAWAEDHYQEALLIAGNAKKFALENLSQIKAIEFLANRIQENL
jgi:hypothetical protein